MSTRFFPLNVHFMDRNAGSVTVYIASYEKEKNRERRNPILLVEEGLGIQFEAMTTGRLFYKSSTP